MNLACSCRTGKRLLDSIKVVFVGCLDHAQPYLVYYMCMKKERGTLELELTESFVFWTSVKLQLSGWRCQHVTRVARLRSADFPARAAEARLGCCMGTAKGVELSRGNGFGLCHVCQRQAKVLKWPGATGSIKSRYLQAGCVP